MIRLSAAIAVWAVHFIAVYGLTGLACARGLPQAVPWAIGVATLLALAALAFLIWVSRKDLAVFANWMTAAVAALALLAILWETVPVLLLPACPKPPLALEGDAENGRLLLRQYGCGSCHRIPGVAAATGKVGPPLQGVGKRVYLGGVLPNTPENMAAWIRAPQKFDPPTAMPDLQVGPEHARDMVAYLYTLR